VIWCRSEGGWLDQVVNDGENTNATKISVLLGCSRHMSLSSKFHVPTKL
jgi:hypothetical protein